MLRRIPVALLLIAVVAVPLIAYAQSSVKSEEPRLIRVDFNSRPEYAEIRVDGVFVGSAPLQYRLTPGVHKIELSRHGFQNWTRELYVSNHTPTNVIALLDDGEQKPCK